MKLTERLDRTKLYFAVAELFAKRSTCERGQVGCVIVRDNRIVVTGYNGAPPGMPHCTEVGCDVKKIVIPSGDLVELGCQRAIHAEANALAFAARHGVATDGATMYCTHGPCLKCAQQMISAGIQELAFLIPYRDPAGEQLFNTGGRVIRTDYAF